MILILLNSPINKKWILIDLHFRLSFCSNENNNTPSFMVFKTSTPTKCHRDVTILCDLGPPLTFIDGLRGLSFSPPLVALCFSSSLCFSTLASSQRPASISRWSGLSLLSVQHTPSSSSFRVKAREENSTCSQHSLWEVERRREWETNAKNMQRI